MNDKLNFEDIIDLLTEKKQIPQKEAEIFLKNFFRVIQEVFPEKETLQINNFGTFEIAPSQTHHHLRFLPASTLSDLVNKPFAHFEKTLLNEGVALNDVEELLQTDSEKVESNIDYALYASENEEGLLKKENMDDDVETIIEKDCEKEKTMFRSKIVRKRKHSDVWITAFSAALLLSVGAFVYLQWAQRSKKKRQSRKTRS